MAGDCKRGKDEEENRNSRKEVVMNEGERSSDRSVLKTCVAVNVV